jgi:hypothetical protein
MKIVVYILYISTMANVTPLLKFESLKECQTQAAELNKKINKKENVKYFCDYLKDNYVMDKHDYFYFLELPYAENSGYKEKN